MFPTFISILDIQSWWEVPSIAHFCSLFRTAFNLLDFDIEDLEEALLTDGTEEGSWLQELIVRLLSGCLPNNEISTFNYQMFLRRLFRQKCQEHDQYNPFNTDVDFQLLPLRTKVDILHALCDFRLDADDVLDQLKNLEADSLRVEPLGYDSNDSAYWYFYGTRLYREDFKTKNNKKKSVWQVICFTEDDWFQLNKKFKKSTAKCERQLYRTLSENFLPELPRLFREKERLARKRLLENQPRRASKRLRKVEIPKEVTYERSDQEESNSDSEQSESRYEMGGVKVRQKKSKGRLRKLSNSSSNSKDAFVATSTSFKRKKSEDTTKSASSSTTTTVGRQTNNSLAAATGQIVIQPVTNSHKKKLKTSQVFRQTDEDLITGMHKILDYVKNHEDAWPFADPVDEEYAPNYYSVIRKPMDLQRMEERLDAGYYKNFDKFRDDFQLIVDNCRLYNGAENEYTEMVDNLSKVFERATEKFLDQISSSDDEIAVEFPNVDANPQDAKKKSENIKSNKRKSIKKCENSPSEESLDKKSENEETKKNKKSKRVKKNAKKKDLNKRKKEVNSSPVRSESRTSIRSFSSSPPPSSVASSPDNRFDFFPKKKNFEDIVDKKKDDDEKKSKPKDKHNKLRETIEKLKAKSEISTKLNNDDEFLFDLDTTKENKEKFKKDKKVKKKIDFEETKKKSKNSTMKNASIEALTIATEQTLKDINKWLDDTPKFSEFSSASNSPSYPIVDDLDLKIDNDIKKKVGKKDYKDIKRRTITRDPSKFLKRREIQRTIDRLQPGKSKGNLISNVQNTKQDDLFVLGPLSKTKDTKNSLIVKTDDNAPKLSLGSVLDNFGKHKFVDEKLENEEKIKTDDDVNNKKEEETIQMDKKEPVKEELNMMSGATPNLSAWFKAFGAPKVQSNQKKTEGKVDTEDKSKDDGSKVPIPEVSPSNDNSVPHGQPVPRQRKISTGSSVSERSSFSQDMDSPRVGIDERLGAYPAPYPSPLYRSPSGASPQMTSPRPELSPKSTPYPPFNGQIRVGFYQDTVSNKSSPDKGCSPRDPQSPYTQCAEHVYTPNTQNMGYNTYYSQNYNNENINQSYYDNNTNNNNKNVEIEQQQQQQQKNDKITQNNMFPVKKRVYNEVEAIQNDNIDNMKYIQSVSETKDNMVSPVLNYSSSPKAYNNYNDPNYQLNIPSRSLPSDRKYNYSQDFSRNMQYTRPMGYVGSPTTNDQQINPNQNYHNPMNNPQQEYTNTTVHQSSVSIPRPTYNTHLDMDQPLGLRGNIANLSHIVDRYNNDERIMSGLQTTQYYGDKGLSSGHMFNKSINTTSGLPIFNQPNMGIQSYNQNIQTSTAIYNRQMTELQNVNSNEVKGNGGSVGGVIAQQSGVEKKTKKRKSNKLQSSSTSDSPTPPNNQGFQSYAGLKSNSPMEPSAISLKTASVVPGSAFNFGPSPSALGISSGLYGDKDAYPNFLDEFRAAPNYYIAAATAAHHRSTPESSDKQARVAVAHQSSAARQTPTYPFIGARQTAPTTYSLGGHFMPSTQTPLMDASSPLYQHYLQAGVLNQGLLGPPGPYPPGYHPALSMRQPYDSMTRPPWL